ncbi:hypothetical protein RRG08_051031 [Elysia crispata]|uniref:Uncharacterized protein n=1 Tax=Elysia crispata TaxID=231223 RepID=A0AAE0Z4Q2_9GAST|nr:hypothetical protein RRG08_051031 [Elysia crispata]
MLKKKTDGVNSRKQSQRYPEWTSLTPKIDEMIIIEDDRVSLITYRMPDSSVSIIAGLVKSTMLESDLNQPALTLSKVIEEYRRAMCFSGCSKCARTSRVYVILQ